MIYRKGAEMEKQPLLSICIPTCNRAEYLKNCLDSLVQQPEFFTEAVEIVISDNASTDDTKQIGEKYAAEYEAVHYFRNEKGIDDRNFPVVLSRANGVLRKLINDSLVFRPGSISYMCDMARKYSEKKPHLFFLNSREQDSFRYRDRIVDFEHFMRQISFYATWIGSFAAWDTECENVEADIAGCEMKLWQVWKLCRLFEEKNSGVVLYRNIVNSQPMKNKLITYDYDQVFYKNFLALLEPSIEKGLLSRDCREKLEKDLLYRFFTGWMTNWELNSPQYTFTQNKDFKQKILDIYKDKPYYRRYLYYYKFRLFLTRSRLYVQAKRGKKH